MDKDKINKGNKITKTFEGGVYEELMHLRKAIYAIHVTNNPSDFTSEQVTEAELLITSMLELNTKIEALKAQQ